MLLKAVIKAQIWVERRLKLISIVSGIRKEPEDRLEFWLNRSKEEYESYLLNNDNLVGQIHGDHYDADISMEPNSDSAKLKTRVMDRVIKFMNETILAKNIPWILLIIPSPIDACENYDWQIDTSVHKDYKRDYLTASVESSAKKYNIDFLNLFQYFNQDNCNDLFFHYGNNHWNNKGQEKAAELMSDMITQGFHQYLRAG